MIEKIQVTKPMLPTLEEYIKEIEDVFQSAWLTNCGEKHRNLEAELKKYLHVPAISLLCNGHMALELTLQAMNLTGEVITTPFTFASTIHAIARSGLTPVFCDILPERYTLDASKLEDLITEKTSAILPVHVYGNVCDYEKIEKVAQKYHLKVIYDAAHTFGMKVNDQGIGNIGDAAIFSFHATKVFHTIEGGAVVSRDSNLIEKLNCLRNFGLAGSDWIEEIGTNGKMNELQAAMGLCNLRHIDHEIGKRATVVQCYREHLGKREGIQLCKEAAGVQSNYAYFPVLFDKKEVTKGTAVRDKVWAALNKEGIFARKYFYPLISDMPCYREQFHCHETPVAKYVSDHILTLPLYAQLPLEEVQRICKIVVSCLDLEKG